MKSQKSDSFPDAIKGPTDAIALRRDSYYSSFPAEVPFNFLVIDVRLILSAAFMGPLEKSLQLSLASASRMEQRERERELEAVDRITGIQRSQEITTREEGRVFCRLARRQEHCSSSGGSISNVNVREGITWPPFREGPVWDPRC
jgi:hypothetical protein